MIPFVVSAGGGVSREAREMIKMINTEVARDEKMEALRINGAFSIILLRYATKMEEDRVSKNLVFSLLASAAAFVCLGQ